MSWVPRIDTQFGNYQIQELIGHGGMSVVYRAQHVSLARNVALKILSPALTEDEGFRERFTRESRLAAALDHPNIIPIYEAGELGGVFFIAMRYVDGPDLRELLQGHGPLDAERSISIVAQVASALTAAHEQGLVHRDVKPANILISATRNGEDADHLYLSDFGIAKHASSQALTKTGMFVGTVDYASPEQIEGHSLDGRSDIYSLGCVLYECLTAAMPYDKDSEVAMLYAHLLEPPPRVTEKRPDLPGGFDEIILKAMAKSRDDRYGTAREFASAVRAELRGLAAGRQPSAPTAQSAGQEVRAVPEDREARARETVPARPSVGAAGDPSVPIPTVPDEPEPGGAPPGGQAQPAPPAHPEPREPRGVVLTSGRLVAAGVALAALLAGTVIAAVALSGDGGGTGPAAGESTRLAGIVPRDVLRNCKGTTARQGAVETVDCQPSATDTAFYPNLQLSFYPNSSAADEEYETLRQANGVKQNFGRCDGLAWSGESAWKHESGKPGGRRFCFFEGDEAVIVWTHGRLGQPSHRDMLGIARANELSNDDLAGWYRFWRDRIGKCPQQDCVARLG